MAGAILTLNAGSSSLKFALYDANPALDLILRGQIEALKDKPHFSATSSQGKQLAEKKSLKPHSFEFILSELLDWIDHHLGDKNLIAVGHRIVHGGDNHSSSERITPQLVESLTALAPLAPLHQLHNLAPVSAIMRHRPRLQQVACFDTAFHSSMPECARHYALPQSAGSEIRRYGFHGLSYEYISLKMREISPILAQGRTIVAHLGNGASLCAMHNGRSIDTTMGFTTLDGLMMGTRSGNLDPGILLYLLQQGRTAQAIEDLLYQHSGLLGVSGISADMRTLLASATPEARLTIDLFVYRAIREIGALTSVLGGLDALIFTAGIGEHASAIRKMICQKLSWLGAKLDIEANQQNSPLISTLDSKIEIRVIPTDEEKMIARHTRDVLKL